MPHTQNVLAAPVVAARARARVPRANSRAPGRRAPRPRGDVSSGAAADERASEFADASVIANNAASLDGKLRTLVVGVEDAQGDERLNHRNPTSGTLFKHSAFMLLSPDLRRICWTNSFTCAQIAASTMPMLRRTGTSSRSAESRSAFEYKPVGPVN